MSYKYTDDTLMHSIGFNPMKLESILKYGLVSDNYARKNNITFARNYNFTLSSDTLGKLHESNDINTMIQESYRENIYLVRYLYISDDPLSAYNMYIKNGISFIVEDVDFIYDKNTELIRRSDEVIVKDHIPKEKITAILIPDNYKDITIDNLDMLPYNILNYKLIVDSINNLIRYLDRYGHRVEDQELNNLLNDLLIAYRSVNSLDKNHVDYNEALEDYKEIISEINKILSQNVFLCFSKILGKEATLIDMVEYINRKYDNKSIVSLESKEKKKWSKKNYPKFHIYLDVI